MTRLFERGAHERQAAVSGLPERFDHEASQRRSVRDLTELHRGFEPRGVRSDWVQRLDHAFLPIGKRRSW